MAAVSLGLAGIGVLLAAIASVLYIIKAFLQSFWWGLAVLCLPFAGLIFLVVHWREARTAFFISLLAGVLVVASVFVNPNFKPDQRGLPNLRALFDPEGHQKDQDKELTDQIDSLRSEIVALEQKTSEEASTLTKEYETLSQKRAALKANDHDAVVAFNQLAADYARRKTGFQEKRDSLAEKKRQVDDLVKTRTANRTASGATSPASPSANVVMYSTRSCPACAAAKDYFAKKGISYVNKEVDSSRDAYDEFRKLGGQAVPLIIINGKRMEGFSAAEIDAALKG